MVYCEHCELDNFPLLHFHYIFVLTCPLTDQIKVRQHDPEESVRMDVVNSLLTVAKKDLKVMTHEMLQFVKERTLDKKVCLKFLTADDSCVVF